MKISDAGLAFIAGHEGFVSTAYRCPAGVLTIGYGFTSRSPAVRKHLGKIRNGLQITPEDGGRVLRAVIDEEFGPATERAMKGAAQHHFDMGVSACFNCGPRVFNWKWLKAFLAGLIDVAAARWRKTATTANGRRLPGLVRRRKEEADLLEHGNYGKGHMPRFEPSDHVAGNESAFDNDVLKEYQEKLKQLGYYDGDLDGLRGPKTRRAVRAFQEQDPHLVNDGILGRGTMESIDRKIEESGSKKQGAGGIGLGLVGTVIGWIGGLPPYVGYVAYGIAALIFLYLLWKYRVFFETKFREVAGI